jgi:hypothetical protein
MKAVWARTGDVPFSYAVITSVGAYVKPNDPSVIVTVNNSYPSTSKAGK